MNYNYVSSLLILMDVAMTRLSHGYCNIKKLRQQRDMYRTSLTASLDMMGADWVA